MSSVKAFPMVVVIFLVSIIFVGLNTIGQESYSNSRLDSESQSLIIQVNNASLIKNTDLNRNGTSLNLNNSNASNFEGADAFERSFLENKESGNIFSRFMISLYNIPDLMILGLNEDIGHEQLNTIKTIIYSFIAILIVVIGLVAIFGEGRFT